MLYKYFLDFVSLLSGYHSYKSCVSTGFAKQIMPILRILRCKGSLVT
jgi:hypothetical protein